MFKIILQFILFFVGVFGIFLLFGILKFLPEAGVEKVPVLMGFLFDSLFIVAISAGFLLLVESLKNTRISIEESGGDDE